MPSSEFAIRLQDAARQDHRDFHPETFVVHSSLIAKTALELVSSAPPYAGIGFPAVACRTRSVSSPTVFHGHPDHKAQLLRAIVSSGLPTTRRGQL
jgi:hypothetical protein